VYDIEAFKEMLKNMNSDKQLSSIQEELTLLNIDLKETREDIQKVKRI